MKLTEPMRMVRIEVRDYLDAEGNGDKTRLLAEIIAGKGPDIIDMGLTVDLSIPSPPSRFQDGKRRQRHCTIFRQNWQEKPEGGCLPVFYVLFRLFSAASQRCRRR